MSSPTQGDAGGSGDKPPGLTRFMRRASKVLRKSSSKRESLSSAQEERPTATSAAAGIPIPEQVTGDPEETAKTPAAEDSATAPADAPSTTTATPSVPAAIQQSIRDIKPSTKLSNPRLAKTAAASNAIQEEKARALFAKYGLTLEIGEWTPPVNADAERIEKKIRIRIYRTCHRCQTTFGADKNCNNCKHTRCKKCTRYPVAKTSTDGKKDGKKKVPDRGVIAVDNSPKMIPLTMRSRVTGKDLERRVPMQRVRRTCHMCSTLFIGKAEECVSCKHLRCRRCPRDPPKLDKYPDSYPGDREEMYPLVTRHRKKIRVHVRWTCHTCQASFKDGEKTCAGCGHQRCDECPRHPPKKVKTEFEEEAVRSVEEKLKNLGLSPQASAA